MCGKAFKRTLAHSAAVTIAAKNFLLLLKSLVANVLNCKAHLTTNLNAYVLLCVD